MATSNSGSLTITVIIGTPAAIAAYLTGEVLLWSIAGAAAMVVVGAALLLGAGVAWFRGLGNAYRQRDWAWLRDLLGAPLLGLAVAVAVASPLAHWMVGPGQSWVNRTFNSGRFGIADVLLFMFGIIFLYLLFTLPMTLAQDGVRLLAYPGFAFYCCYFMAVGLAVTHHLG